MLDISLDGIQVLVQIGLSTGELSLHAVDSAKTSAENLYSTARLALNTWAHFVAQVDVDRGLWGVGVNGVMKYASKPAFGEETAEAGQSPILKWRG